MRGRKSILEEGGTVVNAVGHGVLEIRVRVHSDEVAGVDDGLVGAVDPGRPGVDVTNWYFAQTRSRNDGADLVDVVNDGLRISTHRRSGLNTRWRVSVEILAADRDTSNQACEGRAVLCDRLLEGRDFVVDGSGSPETQEEVRALRNGSWNGRCHISSGTGLNHGIQASTGEAAVGTDEVLGGGEEALEVGLGSWHVAVRPG